MKRVFAMVGGLMLVSGCACITINCEDSFDSGDVFGRYHIDTFDIRAESEREVVSFAVADSDFKDFGGFDNGVNGQGDVVQLNVTVDIAKISRDEISGFNVVMSALTLLILPVYEAEEEWRFDVRVLSRIGESRRTYSINISKWQSSTPLCWIPGIFSDGMQIELGDSPVLIEEQKRGKMEKMAQIAKEASVRAIRSAICSKQYCDYFENRRVAAEKAAFENAKMAEERKKQEENLARMAREKRKESILRDFALTEEPRLWRTVQELRAEKDARKRGLDLLCKEMCAFGRDPDADAEVVSLKAACSELDGAIHSIMGKLEEAYLAYRKMLVMPGQNEYAEMKRMALEDGVQTADSIASKYRIMAKEK